MRFDYLIRHRFYLLALPLLAVCSYFQAQGISALVGSTILAEARPVAEVPRTAQADRSAGRPTSSAPSVADPILSHNVFDSDSGPLRAPEPAAEPPTVPLSPLEVPKCAGVAVTTAAEAENPFWSSAMIRSPGQKHGKLRRVGDAVAELEVLYIGFNPLEKSPAVWFEGEDGVCQAVLFVDPPAKPKAGKPGKKRGKKPSAKRTRRPQRKVPPPLPKSIASRIARVGPNEFHVDRRAVEAIFEQYPKLVRSVGIRPNQQNGRTTSLTLRRVPNNSLLGTLGLRPGDKVVSANGFSLTSPEQALQAYARLRVASNISLEVKRNGRPMVIDYVIR